MTLTPINLNKARKAKARADAAALAAENRIKFGRTKSEKQANASTTAKAARDLDGHKRDLQVQDLNLSPRPQSKS